MWFFFFLKTLGLKYSKVILTDETNKEERERMKGHFMI